MREFGGWGVATPLCGCKKPQDCDGRTSDTGNGKCFLLWRKEPKQVADKAAKKAVDQPHYSQAKFQPIVFIMENNLDFWRGSIVKYVVRAGHKVHTGMTAMESEIADLEKIKHFADIRINFLKGEDMV